MNVATTVHDFVPGAQRPSSAGWYALCALCGGTEDATFGPGGASVHVWRHAAEPVPVDPLVPAGAIVCRVCGVPVRTADGGRFPIHART